MKKLPKTLYVKIDGDAPDQFFNASDYADALVDMGDRVKIGTYQLVSIATAEGVASFGKATKPR